MNRVDRRSTSVSLYAKQPKIYPRSVHGWFARWRWALVWLTQLVFYGLPWLPWNGRQAVLFDLAARRFYIFDLVLYPQDFIYLTGLLIVCGLRRCSSSPRSAGRLWCGYACPQTVYTEIFLWVEHRIEGDRGARMRLDKSPWTSTSCCAQGRQACGLDRDRRCGPASPSSATSRRSAPCGPRPSRSSFGPWEWFWVMFYGFATYGNAGFLREQVCKYMCPYARFQSAMFDRDTLIVSYDAARGEPRGPRARSADLKAREPRRLHRLRPVRAGLPDRHRHPQRPAVRVHRLRRLHRRLRRRDGQDELPARADPLRHRERRRSKA